MSPPRFHAVFIICGVCKSPIVVRTAKFNVRTIPYIRAPGLGRCSTPPGQNYLAIVLYLIRRFELIRISVGPIRQRISGTGQFYARRIGTRYGRRSWGWGRRTNGWGCGRRRGGLRRSRSRNGVGVGAGVGVGTGVGTGCGDKVMPLLIANDDADCSDIRPECKKENPEISLI